MNESYFIKMSNGNNNVRSGNKFPVKEIVRYFASVAPRPSLSNYLYEQWMRLSHMSA